MEDDNETTEVNTRTTRDDHTQGMPHHGFESIFVTDRIENNGDGTSGSHISAKSLHSCGESIRKLIAENATERLEAGYTEGLKILHDLQKPLKDLKGNKVGDELFSQIQRIRDEAAVPRTVIGFLGNTGAGKSSLINALLDVENIVPTSGMQACTSVATEISNDDSESPDNYHAHIEFIKAEDWKKELKILREEILESDGTISRDVLRAKSEAAVAYSKIRAVYPGFDDKNLVSMSTEELMSSVIDQDVLGKSLHIQEGDSLALYNRLKHYVESSKKGLRTSKTIIHREFQYWPLIKVVKIHLKADILSTGAVLVDLPGIQDSNAARSAVAEEYIKNCTALCIVAPITRAVNDKVAKDLLGDSFKEQLKFDGKFSAITFICSKTDDISLSEISEGLDLGAEYRDLEEQFEQVSSARCKSFDAVQGAKEALMESDQVIEELEHSIEALKPLQDDLFIAQTAHASDKGSSKRKLPLTPATPSKRRQQDPIKREVEAHQHPDMSGSNTDVPGESGKAPSAAEIKKQLSSLKRDKQAKGRESKKLSEEIAGLEKEVAEADKELEANVARRTAIAIEGRNKHSRREIQQDFAAGVRQADRQAVFEDEEEGEEFEGRQQNFRDYDRLADDLPVFCVSSRAYQKLSDRLRRDNKVTGFFDVQQTEIPQLQAHCKALTAEIRRAYYREFLNSIQLLSNSLGLWASSSVGPSEIARAHSEKEQAVLSRELKNLKEGLNGSATELLRKVEATLADDLTSTFDHAVKNAAYQAVSTANGWGDRSVQGSLKYPTYKATVRRSGAYHGAAGDRDFNRELLQPMTKTIAPKWDTTFNSSIPDTLQEFRNDAIDKINMFFTALKRLPSEGCCSHVTIDNLVNSLQGVDAKIPFAVNSIGDHVAKWQKDHSRQFKPSVTSEMLPAYETCANECGPGSFQRMKDSMMDHVDDRKDAMFRKASTVVKDSVTGMRDSILGSTLREVNDILAKVETNVNTVKQRIAERNAEVSEEEKAARKLMRIALQKANHIVIAILDADVDDLKAGLAATRVPADTHQAVILNAPSGDEMEIDEPASHVGVTEDTFADEMKREHFEDDS